MMSRCLHVDSRGQCRNEADHNTWPERCDEHNYWPKAEVTMSDDATPATEEVRGDDARCWKWRETGRSYCTLKAGHEGPHVCPPPPAEELLDDATPELKEAPSLRARIVGFRDLKKDWDSYGAPPIHPGAIALAADLLTVLKGTPHEIIWASPTNDEAILLDTKSGMGIEVGIHGN